MIKKIRVLLVDDSIVFREALARGLSSEPRFDILPTASSAQDAILKIKQCQPHIIISDIEMPGMNGLDFVSQLSKFLAIPTIMLSSRDDLKYRVLQAGAAAFLSKPKAATQNNIKNFMVELMHTILSVAETNVTVQHNKQVKLIAIGASTGGTETITELLQQLPVHIPPIVIVQHIPEHFSAMFAKRLNDILPYTVKEAGRLETLFNNHVYIAPGNQHMIVKNIQGKLAVQCSAGEKINGHCPSVDILFSSVADTVKHAAIGVILTGMGKDGAEGLLKMKQAGCYTIGQDEKTSIVYGMPKAAYDIGAVKKQLPVHNIAHDIIMHI